VSLATEILGRLPARPQRQVTVTCVTETPFTVFIDGDYSVAVPARIQAGSTFSSGESGWATWTAPSLPICFKTT